MATIFYVKSELVFCEHADTDAKLYFEQEESRKLAQEERRKKQGNDATVRKEGGRDQFRDKAAGGNMRRNDKGRRNDNVDSID